MSKNLAILGIDGGSWNVLNWLIREGYMPSLKNILARSVSGRLKSVIPPVTGAAWLSIATGLNPGKTGVIDFFKHVGNFVLRLVSADDFRGKSIWDYLSVLGYRVAVLDYPMLYPSYPVNGIMLSSWGGRVDSYPRELLEEIRSLVGSYDVFVDYHLEKYNDIDLFLEDLEKATEKKLKVSRSLMRREWSLFIDVISFTDWIQHRMWHYIDPNHPLHPNQNKTRKYIKKFAEFWQLLDDYIAEITETYDNVMIVSDHGFGPQWGVFNLVRWLVKHGFSIPRRTGIRMHIARLITTISSKMRLYRFIPEKLRRKASRHGLNALSPLSFLDPKRSLIVTLEYTIPFGALHINHELCKNSKQCINEVIKALKSLGDEIGKQLRVEIWRAEDIYNGSKVKFLPDIIFSVNNWSCVIVKDPTRDFIYMDSTYSPRHTGSHRLHGIFIAWGRDFRKGIRVDEVSILDIAPTVLYMFGAPIPSNMDGRVLRGLLSYGGSREPRYVSPLYYRVRRVKRELSGGG